MKQKMDLLKKLISKYQKAFINSAISAFSTALPLSWLPAIYKIRGLEIGEYPEEPAEIILARLREMRPVYLKEAVIKFLLIFIISFFIYSLYWFKKHYNINLVDKLIKKICKKG